MNKSRVVSSAEVRMVKHRLDGTAVDLGVVSAEYRNPVRAVWWRLVGKPLADRRIARENRRASLG